MPTRRRRAPSSSNCTTSPPQSPVFPYTTSRDHLWEVPMIAPTNCVWNTDVLHADRVVAHFCTMASIQPSNFMAHLIAPLSHDTLYGVWLALAHKRGVAFPPHFRAMPPDAR